MTSVWQRSFSGDLDALDRLDALASQFARVDDSFRAALVQAEVASAVHRFEDARDHLARAAALGGPSEAIERHRLTIDQACGVELDAVLAARRRIATASGRLEDLVPLGAVLADLERFAEADAVYRQAFYSYDDVSPFPLAWVCFQLGMLWGELVPAPDPALAAVWYQRAIAYLPGYVKARVHLAEIYASQDRTADAEALLRPALSSRDPEVRWRLADVLIAQGRAEEAEIAARSGAVWLRAASWETPARLRGSCRGVLRRQRQRLPAGARTRPHECRESSDAPCGQAGRCDRGEMPMRPHATQLMRS